MLVITLHAFTSEVEVYTYKGRQFGNKKANGLPFCKCKAVCQNRFVFGCPG